MVVKFCHPMENIYLVSSVFFTFYWIFEVRNVFLFEFLGIVLRIWIPLFEVLKQRVEKCAIGYIEIMQNIVHDNDRAMITKNSSYLLLVFKVFANAYRMLLPFIHDKKIRKNFVDAIETGKPLLESLSNGRIDWREINKVVCKDSNGLNDSL